MNNNQHKSVNPVIVNHSIANMLDVTPSYPVATQTSNTPIPKKSDKLFNTITVFSNIMFFLYTAHYNDLIIKHPDKLFSTIFTVFVIFTVAMNVSFFERLYKRYKILDENRTKVELLFSFIFLILTLKCLFV